MDGWHKMMEVQPQDSTIEQHTQINKQNVHVNNSNQSVEYQWTLYSTKTLLSRTSGARQNAIKSETPTQ